VVLHGALDGQPIRSCVTPVSAVAGKEHHHHRAVGNTPAGKKISGCLAGPGSRSVRLLSSGQIMSASAAAGEEPHPSDADIDSAYVGEHLPLRTYTRIRASHQAGGAGPAIAAKGA